METLLRIKQEHLQDDFSKYGFVKDKWPEGIVWEKPIRKTKNMIVKLLLHTKQGKVEIELDNTETKISHDFTKYLWTDFERKYSREVYDEIQSDVFDDYEVLLGIELPGALYDLIVDGVIEKVAA